jgi:hypothetical protein
MDEPNRKDGPMTITDELQRLGRSAKRLNQGSDELNRLIERIDRALGALNIGLDFVLRRPIDEVTGFDHNGKRVIELSYVAYQKVSRDYHLVVRTVKVMESKLAAATEAPGTVTLLLTAPRRLRYAAVDVLPELVHGLSDAVEEMLEAMDRRQRTAAGLVDNLETVAAQAAISGSWVAPADLPMTTAGVPTRAKTPSSPPAEAGSESHAAPPSAPRSGKTVLMGSG